MRIGFAKAGKRGRGAASGQAKAGSWVHELHSHVQPQRSCCLNGPAASTGLRPQRRRVLPTARPTELRRLLFLLLPVPLAKENLSAGADFG